MSFFEEPISGMIWDIKYRYHDETRIEKTWKRVAKAIARIESKENRIFWEKEFYEALKDFRFLPGGRILAGAGTKHKVTLFNCFVMPVSDSLTGIFDGLKEGAQTLQEGGGIGYDFSTLRPSGSPVEHTGGAASGPVSFMRIWDAMCATMESTGSRRGAMMAILRCDHPDIEKFVTAKSEPHELRHFNVSVAITDDFMQSVKNNSTKAAALWKQIIKSAYETAEPGVIFIDTINRLNTLWYCENITATNPCGEIPLPTYGACNLGAINLTKFVINPYSDKAEIDWLGIEKIASIATRFLDNVIDVSRYPLALQKKQAQNTRRIGLGITGLADMFVMLGIKYGSEESLQLARRLMQKISFTTWMISIELAKERGSFPLFNKDKYLQGEFVKPLDPAIQEGIEKFGVRNSHHNTIAPTGTISLLANNISNGIEPIFSDNFMRTVRLPSGELSKHYVTDYALRLWQKNHVKKSLPPAWVDTQTLLPEDHLNMQAAMQPYIDNAISKTINIPVDFPFEKLIDVYTKAYELGLKGCTIFRPNLVTGSVLEDHCCQV